MQLERQLKIALAESRLLILGAQVLFGFSSRSIPTSLPGVRCNPTQVPWRWPFLPHWFFLGSGTSIHYGGA